MKKIFLKPTVILIILLLATSSLSIYLFYGNRNTNLQNKIINLENEISESESKIKSLQEKIEELESEKEAADEIIRKTEARLEKSETRIEKREIEIQELERLQEIDNELLKKYSKIYFLNENYEPISLSPIPEKYLMANKTDLQIHSKVLPFLEELLEDAENDGISLGIISAYRSFGTQAELKSSYKVTYGEGANAFSADQGYSEHQLGTTVDFSSNENGQTFSNFESTEAYRWLLQNAKKYGFTLSYPANNQYYIFEPWHWRFVGKDLADDLQDENKSFYDLDQREIDGYKRELFED